MVRALWNREELKEFRCDGNELAFPELNLQVREPPLSGRGKSTKTPSASSAVLAGFFGFARRGVGRGAGPAARPRLPALNGIFSASREQAPRAHVEVVFLREEARHARVARNLAQPVR